MNKWMVAIAVGALLAAGCQASAPAGAASPSPAATAVQPSEGDRTFIDGMVPHHESALVMADDALAKAGRQELKDFAVRVKVDQAREIHDMKAWRQAWFGSSATPSDHSGHTMAIPAGPDFDRNWAEAMITHHEGALEMGRKALTDAARPESKVLAQHIIDAQQQEIAQLRAWIQAWSPPTSP